MGWVDWLMRPFRGRPVDADVDGDGTSDSSSGASGASGASVPRAAKTPKTPKTPKPAKAQKSAKPPPTDASGEKRKKKGRKYGRPEVEPTVTAPRPDDDAARRAEAERFEARRRAEAEARAAAAAVAPTPEPRPEAPPPRAEDPAAQARRAEAAENRRRANVPRFQGLLAHADALLAVPDAALAHLRAGRRELVDGWGRLGAPPVEDREAMAAARDERVAAFDARIRAAAEAAEAARQAVDAERMAVVDEARALAEREELKGAGPLMGELRTKLRAFGKIPADHPAAIAFAAAEARLKERQEQIRTARDTAREEALERLRQLVQRAEALAQTGDAESAAERVKGLQATWKGIRVPGPRTEVDELWARFRGACDAVFTKRTEARIESGKATLERLEAIVVKVEALVEEGLDGDPDDEIDKVLTAWKRAGRAPREAQQPLWERLQRAFDQLRSPVVDLGPQDEGELQFRPFAGLERKD